MANQVWNRLGQITTDYKKSQQTPTLSNSQLLTYSKLYPWLTEESYNKMVNAVDSLGFKWEARTNAMNNYYRTHVKTLINDQELQQRDDIINQQAYEAAQLNNKDADAQLRMTEAVQKAKKLWNLDAKANDAEVFSTMVETLWENGINLAWQYLSWENDDFLTATWLKEKQTTNKNVTWWEIWDNIRTKANIPVDSMKKWWQRTINELWALAYKNMLKGVWWDNIKGLSVDEVTDNMIDNIVRDEVLEYQQNVNERYRAKELQNLDQDIQNYYNNKGYTKLLWEWDWKWFMYKSLWDAAQNREMPVVIAASVFQPEVWFALMATDTYARENQEAFENMLNNWATYEQAENWAVAVWLINAAVEVWLEKLLGWVETKASDAIRKTFMKNVQQEATKKWLGRILVDAGKTQLRASWEEWLEEIVQQIVQNAATKTVNENQDLFEWVGTAFEWGFYNPLNLLAGGGNLNQNLSQNKDVIREQIMDGAYNAGVWTRIVTDKAWSLLNSLKDRVNKRADIQNQTTDNVEVETTENSWILDKVTDWWAEKITNTVSAQDKLYKAQEPRMNVLSNKKNLEKRRANSDRANQLIIQNGYIPTNTAERVDAHQKTINTLWEQIKQQINQWEWITIDQTSIINALEDYINEKKSLNIAWIEADISALEKELESLKRSQEEWGTDLPILENKKQVFNDLVDWKGQEASEVYKWWLKLISQEIWKIEDNLLSEIPWEFSNLKRDVWALLDTYEDVFKADMKNQRSKWVWLTEAYSRIEWIWDIIDWVLWVFSGDGKKVITWLWKVALWKSLAKAKDVDFLVKTWFRDLANQMWVEGNVMNEDTTPTNPTTPTTVAEQEIIQTPTEEVKVEETKKVKPKKETVRKGKLDTKKIASDYMRWDMDWNKYQHLAWLTEEQALGKRWEFVAAVDEEWDKNQDYYNNHQSELVDKFHTLLEVEETVKPKKKTTKKSKVFQK